MDNEEYKNKLRHYMQSVNTDGDWTEIKCDEVMRALVYEVDRINEHLESIFKRMHLLEDLLNKLSLIILGE